MKVLVIGATGHIGSYLVPELVKAGHDVVALSRKGQLPYYPGMSQFREIPSVKGIDIIPPALGKIENAEYRQLWDKAKQVQCDRLALENQGKFGEFVTGFEPDVVCDLLCYTAEQAKILADTMAGSGAHLISIGSIWVFGYNITTPADETHPRNGYGQYAQGKIEIERYLLGLSEGRGLDATILHPGHIVGSGWIPLNPQGHFNLDVFRAIKVGEQITLPDTGLQTFHHVHAADVAGLAIACIEQREKSRSQNYMTTSRRAVTLRGFAEEIYCRYGKTPNIKYIPYPEFIAALSELDAAQSEEHISRSPCVSMEKAWGELGFRPKYSSFDAVFESLSTLEQMGVL